MLKENSVQKFLARRLREYYEQAESLSIINIDALSTSTLTHLDSQKHKMNANVMNITSLLATCSTAELEKMDIVEVVNKFPEIKLLEHL
jgi:hypothetical protein